MRRNSKHRQRQSSKGRSGFSMLEMVVVVVIIGITAAIVVSRMAGGSDEAKRNACFINKHNLEVQAQLWYRHQGTWPAANLSDMAADSAYLPDGLPTCPVDGSAYTFNSATQAVNGHTH